MKRSFHIGDVLSITTGRLLSRHGFAGVHEIIGHFDGTPMTDSGCMVLAEKAKDHAEKHLPWTKEVDYERDMAKCDGDVDRFIVDMAAKYGEYHDLPPFMDHYRISTPPHRPTTGPVSRSLND